MKALVTGSSGHLGEALVRTLRDKGQDVTSLDIKASPFTTVTGTITDRACVRACMRDVKVVYHTATLHKPHVATHDMDAFVATNVAGTLALLEEAAAAGVESFVFTSTTSVFGEAMRPPAGQPAAWVTEALAPVPRNIYGVTKIAAEGLCRLMHRKNKLNCVVLRTSRFFPEDDDNKHTRDAFAGDNAKANEFLFRRADIEDVVSAHLLAGQRAPDIGFGCYIISATTPFLPEDLVELRSDAPAVLARRVPGYEEIYQRLGWKMFDGIERVYVNSAARKALGWRPRFDFENVLQLLESGSAPRGELAGKVGSKGYHDEVFKTGPYPVE